MQPLRIVAPDPATATAVRDRLASALAEHGSVAVVADAAIANEAAPDVDTAYHLTDDGRWTAAGRDLDVEAVLARLAPDHDYALITGSQAVDVPVLAVGDGSVDGSVLARVDGPDEVDADRVRDALADAEPFVTLESLIARAKRSADADKAGAVATFTGRVRERDDRDDTPTARLEFEKYAGVAEDRMAALGRELSARDGVYEVLMHHRTGVIEAGEDIVFVVVLAGHREEAFRTVEDGINRLKAEVPIFKKEVTLDETFWVHERS